MSEVLSVLSGIVFLIAFFPYIKAIVQKQTRPRKATWLIWAVSDVVILAGMIANNTINGQMVAASLGATIVFVLSIRFGERGWTGHDKVCIALSSIAIAAWIYFGESNLGIAFSLLSLAIAVWPTYVSAWENPANEDARGWVIFEVSSILAVLAIPQLTFANAAPPIAFLLIDTPMMYLLFIRPALRRRTEVV